MQDIVTYLNSNFTAFQTSKRSFTNEKGDDISYDQLQIVTGINDSRKVYDVKLGRDAKILLRSDVERQANKIDVNQD